MMKQLSLKFGFFLLLITFLIPSEGVAQVLVNPPCSNTVCVDREIRAVAQHEEVVSDGYPSYYIQLHHAVPCADNAPQETGVTVHRQVQRGLWQHVDSLCTGQGCYPAGNPNDGARLCVQ